MTKKPKIERLSIALDKIKPYPRNPRKHSPEQIEHLASLMREFGQTQDIVVDERMVILMGHGRLAAAQKIGWKQASVTVFHGLSDKQKRALRIADNRSAETSEWDFEALRLEVSELKGFDEYLLLGFDPSQLSWIADGDVVIDGANEWGGMPEFTQQNIGSFRAIIVHFKDQAAVDAFAKRIKQRIPPKQKSIWFPEAEIGVYADKRYAAE